MSADDGVVPEAWVRSQVEEAFAQLADTRTMERKPLPGARPSSRSPRGLAVGLLALLAWAFAIGALLIGNATFAGPASPDTTPAVVTEILDVDPHPDQP